MEARSIKSLRVIPMIEVTVKEGKGTLESPYRIDVEYWTLDGIRAAVNKGEDGSIPSV